MLLEEAIHQNALLYLITFPFSLFISSAAEVKFLPTLKLSYKGRGIAVPVEPDLHPYKGYHSKAEGRIMICANLKMSLFFIIICPVYIFTRLVYIIIAFDT